MNRWQAIVFDLDDTLYPECDYVISGFYAVACWADQHLDIPKDPGFASLVSLFRQGVRGKTFDCWLAQYGIRKNRVTELVEVYRLHHPQIAPFPEIPNLLSSLHKHYKLGLVSDGYLAVQQRKFTALGLSEHFDTVVFSDEWGRDAWKPAVKPFEMVLQQLGCQAVDSVYIGDNPMKDFLGAKQIGMFTIWVRRPDGEYTHINPPTEQHEPDLMVTSLSELEQVLAEE